MTNEEVIRRAWTRDLLSLFTNQTRSFPVIVEAERRELNGAVPSNVVDFKLEFGTFANDPLTKCWRVTGTYRGTTVTVAHAPLKNQD